MRNLVWSRFVLGHSRSPTLYTTIHRTMSTRKVKVGVCQMTTTNDRTENLNQGRKLIEKCKIQNAQMAFLPEAFDSINLSTEEALADAEFLDGPTISAYRFMAKSNSMWLSLGGFKEKSKLESKIYNTHIIIDANGDIAGKYSKLHLFDVHIPGKVKLCETDSVIPGKEITSVVPSPAGNVGLCVCYDLRFPELSTILREEGADILTYPSAFTIPTGKVHWEVLLRARAIESQCYVIAAAQVGQHNPKRASYGHSMVVDPWGKVLCDIADGIDIAIVEIDLDYLQQVRKSMPLDKHRRRDMYHLQKLNPLHNQDSGIDDIQVYSFAQLPVPSSVTFYKTKLSFAFVNKKPVLPGHMLVSPLRVAKRFADLTPAETTDLFEAVRVVSDAVKKEFEADSLTITIQDGPDSGQSIEHVHVHILPRRKGDFERNDDIYEKLATHDKGEDGKALSAESSLWRSVDMMSEEAGRMRKYFVK